MNSRRFTALLRSGLARRVASGTFWSLAGAVGSRLFAVVASILIARALGKEGFGKLGVVQSTATVFQTIGGFALGLTSTKYIALYRDSDPSRAGGIGALSSLAAFVTGTLAAACLFGASAPVARVLLGAAELAPLVKVSALGVLLSAVNGAQLGVLVGFEAFRSVAVVNVLYAVCNLALGVLGAAYAGVAGAVWGSIAALFCMVVCSNIATRAAFRAKRVVFSFRAGLRELRVLKEFSLPAMAGGLIGTPAVWLSQAIVVNEPSGFLAMGAYNAAGQWRTAIMFLPGLVSQVLLPVMAQAQAKDGHGRLAFANVGLCSGVALLAALPIAAFSSMIVGAYGDGFRDEGRTLVLMAAVAVFASAASAAGNYLVSSGTMWIGVLFNLTWATGLLSLTYLFRQQGAEGLALANLIAYAFHAAICLLYMVKKVGKDRGGSIPAPTSEVAS